MCNFQRWIGILCWLAIVFAWNLEAEAQQLELSGKFQNCSADKIFKLNVNNKTPNGIYTSFRIEWGDGENTELTKASASHEYTSKGQFELLFFGKKEDGTEDRVSYTVYNDGGTPELKLAAGGESGLCRGSMISFVLSGLEKNTDLTSYLLDYGDGNIEQFTGAKYSGQTAIEFEHQYNKSYCDFLAEGGDIEGMKIKITAINVCQKRFEMTAGPYKVADPVTVQLKFPEKECTGNSLDFSQWVKYEPEDCIQVDLTWDILGVEDNVALPYTFTDRGEYTIRASGIKENIECSKGKDQKVLKIIQRVKAELSVSIDTICEGESVEFDASASEGDDKEFFWSVISGNGDQVEWIPGQTAEKTKAVFKKHGSYYIQLQVGNGCSYDYKQIEIVVKKNPEIKEFRPLESRCPNKVLKLSDYIAYDWTWEGNPHQPTWTIQGPAGGSNFVLGDKHSEYPVLNFTKAGVYTLQVELAGVGCGDETKLKASRTIDIYDPAIRGEITHTSLDICEDKKVVFTNQMAGVHLTTTWEVTKADGSAAEGDYISQPDEPNRTMTFHFKRYGDYKVKAWLTAECGDDYKEFTVKVRKAPEVYFTEFPSVICPEVPFLPGDYLDFRSNGNEDLVTFTWTVNSDEEPAQLEGEHSRSPKIIFPTYGKYTLGVTITNPTSCTSPSLVISKVVMVSDPRLVPDIKPDLETICVGQQVTFSNNSLVGVEPTYYWGISPAGYQFVNEGGESSKEPVVKFTRSGVYSITAVVTGVCRPESVPFTIIVQEDPEVILDSIPPICPGTLSLVDTLVHYSWNDSWKTGAESTRRVQWKLVEKPAGAQCTPPESLVWNDFNPTIQLNTPGIYKLKVEAKSDASCGGTKMIAEREVEVYNPNIQVNLHPKETAEVIKLAGNDKYQVVEGSPVTFDNQSVGVGLHYLWSVDQPEYVENFDNTASEPSIVFKKFGTYKVKVDLIGACSSESREFTILVKGIPKFTFLPIPDRCEAGEEVDLKQYLTCDSAGSSEIICSWNIAPATGYSFLEGTASDLFYKIKFNTAGNYTLTLEAKAEYGGVQTVQQTVRVLRKVVQAKAQLPRLEGCTTDGLRVVARDKSEGDLLNRIWTITPEEGNTAIITPDSLVADMLKEGNYQIKLKVENICGVDSIKYDIRAYAKPEVEVLGATDLGAVCEQGYRFIGTEHVGNIKENNDPLNWIEWEISPEGAVFGNGSLKTDRRPNLTFAGDNQYVITGKFKNHCKDTVKVQYTLKVDKYVDVELMEDTALCAYTQPLLLEATPGGGQWSCSDEQALLKETESYYFDPYANEQKIFELTYQRGNGQCMASRSMTIEVDQLPVVNAGIDRQVCWNDAPVKLEGVLPVLGEWKGIGVENGWFYPEKATPDTLRLEYWVTDMGTGCSNLDTIQMVVSPLPDPSFRASAIQCRQTDSLYVPLELGKGHHFSWDFGNEDIVQTEDAPASYHYPVEGNYTVTLTATSVNGCQTISAPRTVKVLKLPPTAEFSLQDTAQCGPFTVLPLVKTEHFAGDFYHLNYEWDYGNGQQSMDLLPEAQTYQAGLWDTTYQITFRVYSVCGEQLDSALVGVWSKPVAHFTINPDRPEGFCTPATPLFINGSTGSNNKYHWDFAGLGSSQAVDTSYTFEAKSSATDYMVRLLATNRCDEIGSAVEHSLKVKLNPIVAGFSMSQKYLCAGDTVCFTNNSVDRDPVSDQVLLYEWNFGDGEISDVWDTCHRYQNPGAYGITLSLDNGCARKEFTDSVFVHVLPVLHLEKAGPICEDLELAFTVSSEEPLKNITWDFGDNSPKQKGLFQISHVFEEPGFYEVKVRGEASQIPACPGEAVEIVEIWSNPRVQILPLDTMACSPLEYMPELVATGYDYFRWDYGDGTEMTSEVGHTYRNDSNVILTYPLNVYVENNLGCREEHHGLIRVYNSPKAALDKSILFGHPEKVHFINLSREYTECLWYLPDGRVVNSPEDQILTFEREATYPLSLTALNEYGCRDSVFLEHRSYESGLYFPNSFIPHSSNPKVNQFNGIGMGLKEYKLEILDMYGNKIWETTALDNGMPSEGWDGRNKKGELLPQGVYTWRAEAVFCNEEVWTGKNNRSGKTQTTQGTVLLLRK